MFIERLILELPFLDREFAEILFLLLIGSGLFALLVKYANREQEEVLAKIISWIFNGFTNALIPLYIAGILALELSANSLMIAFFTTVAYALLAFGFLKLKLINDLDISDRSKRPLFMVFACLLFLLTYLSANYFGSVILVKVALALVTTSVFFTLISTFWKISGHMTYLLFAITSINFMFLNKSLFYLYLLVPSVAWARVRLKHHTIAQTVLGTLTALILSLSVFYLV